LYAPHGAVRSVHLGNARWETTIFNNRLQPTLIALGDGVGATNLWSLSLGYHPATPPQPQLNNGNLLSETITVNATTSFAQTFTYDHVNRLETATEANAWAQTYGYDRFGNRWIAAGLVLPGTQPPQAQADFDAATNRLTGGLYLYDQAGNLTRDRAGVLYTYDAENRQKSAGGSTYDYDGDGRRVRKTVGGIPTVFVYSAAGQLAAEYGPYGGGGGTRYVTRDHLGSTRVTTSPLGTVTARLDYLPFGEQLPATMGARGGLSEYSLPPVLNQRFTGKERDSESGLDYFGARYMSGTQGRFTSVDPVKITPVRVLDPQRLNLYAYVRNNPLKYVDPRGEDVYLANKDEAGRRKALAAITVNLRASEQRNLGYRQNRDGKYELYLKKPSAIDTTKASAGYQYLAGMIGDHGIRANVHLVLAGGSAVGQDGARYSHQTLCCGESFTAGLNIFYGRGNIDVLVPEDGAPRGVRGLTASGKDIGIAMPDFLIMAHELLGESFKYMRGNEALQKNIVDDSEKVIAIENEIRQFHGLPLRSGNDHGYVRAEVTVRP
jgi:RHS repeat-associated protein